MQTLEEKAVMVAKAIVSRTEIWVDGTNGVPTGFETRAHDFVVYMRKPAIRRLIVYGNVSLTPPPQVLLPCPFCGNSESVSVKNAGDYRTSDQSFLYEVRCGLCGAGGGRHRIESDASAAWNRRTS